MTETEKKSTNRPARFFVISMTTKISNFTQKCSPTAEFYRSVTRGQLKCHFFLLKIFEITKDAPKNINTSITIARNHYPYFLTINIFLESISQIVNQKVNIDIPFLPCDKPGNEWHLRPCHLKRAGA